LETDKSRYRGTKVLYLIRDPRDVVVSCFFQATRRKKLFRGTLSEFIRSDNYGIRKIVCDVTP
jgi:Sulfotransferase domain